MEPLFGPASLENPLFTAMHINEMPEDCLRLVIESLSIGSSLNELVQKAFVCSSWFTVIQALMRLWHGTSLKLFESERNFDLYRRFVISDCRLNQVDARFALKEPLGKHQPPLPWTEQDHLMLRRFTGVSLRLISTALGAFFGEQVDHLVIHTFDIVQTDILRAFPLLTSLTFVELPDDQDVQADIWRYLDTSHRHLKHLAIFHSASAEPLNPVLLGPVLSRLESFTLDRYIHANRFAVFSHLNPQVCTRISVGRLGSWREAKLFREQFTSELPDLAPALVLLEMNPWAFARRRTVPFTWRDPHDRTEERFNVPEHRRAIFEALVIGRLNRLDAEVEEAEEVDPQVPQDEDQQDRRVHLRNRIIQEWINYEAANEDNDDDWLDVWALNAFDTPLVRRWLQALPPEQIRTLFDPIRLSPERVQAEDVLLASFTQLCEAQRQNNRGAEEAEEELENPLIGEMAMEALELGHPPEELPELIANLQAMARGLVRPEELPHGLRPLAHRVPPAPAGAIQNRPVPMDAPPPPAEPVAAAVNAERANPVMFLRNFIQAGRRAGGVLLRGMFQRMERRHHPLPQPNHPREEIILVNQDAIEEVEEEEESDNEDDEIDVEEEEDNDMAIDVIEVDIENNNYHHHHHHHHHPHAVEIAQERQHRELQVENGELHGLLMPENLLRIQGIAFARDRVRENQEAQVAPLPPPAAGPPPTRMVIPSRENTLLRLQKVVQLRERRRREEQRAAAAAADAAAAAAAANDAIPADGGAVVVGAELGPIARAGALVRPYQEHVNQDAMARRRRARALHPRNNRLWAAAAREQQQLHLAPEVEAPLLLGEWPRPGRARRLAMLRRGQW